MSEDIEKKRVRWAEGKWPKERIGSILLDLASFVAPATVDLWKHNRFILGKPGEKRGETLSIEGLALPVSILVDELSVVGTMVGIKGGAFGVAEGLLLRKFGTEAFVLLARKLSQ